MAPLDWSKVKPSTSPDLRVREVEALPFGMVVISRADGEVLMPTPSGLMAWSEGVPGSLLEGAWVEAFGELRHRHHLCLPKLPRLSFALTKDAVRKRQKTVTRRLALPSWWKEGALFLGVDRIRQAGAQGLCIARCGPENREPLVAISQDDVNREGFPHTTPEGFISMFRSTAPRDWDGWVWRLPFSYLEIPE